MIAVDSAVWIDFLNGDETREAALLSSLLGAEPLRIGDIVGPFPERGENLR